MSKRFDECTLEEDDKRYTLVHDRFQIVHAPMLGLIGTDQTRAGAMEQAENQFKYGNLGVPHTEVELFDSMARRGCADTWSWDGQNWHPSHYRFG